jgi:hypothetical protein
MVILGVVGAMETPNGTACIPQLVANDKLESANGIVQAVQSLSGIAAPIIGGVLYSVLSMHILVLVSCAAFALAAVTEAFIHIPFVARTRKSDLFKTLSGDLKDGFAYVWHEPFIRKLMVLAALFNLVLVPCFLVTTPLILRITLHCSDTLYGTGIGLLEVAMILGAVLVGVFSKRMRVSTIWLWILGIATLFAPLALSVTPILLDWGTWQPFALFMLCAMLMVMATSILSIFVIARVQEKTPSENLGKVMAIVQAAAQCAAPIGQLLYGGAFAYFNRTAYIPLLLAGGLTFVIACIGKTLLQKEGVKPSDG